MSAFCAVPVFFRSTFAEDFQKLPSIFEVRVAGTFPASPRGIFAIIVIFFPEDFAFPDEFSFDEMIADDVVAGDVIRKERLDIDDNAPAIFDNADAFIKDAEKFREIALPKMSVLGFLIIEAEIIRRRGKDEVDAIIGQFFKEGFAIGADNFIVEALGQGEVFGREGAAVGVEMFASYFFFRGSIFGFALFIEVFACVGQSSYRTVSGFEWCRQ